MRGQMVLTERYHMGPECRCLVHDLNIMCAIKSQYKAFGRDVAGIACFCSLLRVRKGPTGWILVPSKAQAEQSLLDRTSFFPM